MRTPLALLKYLARALGNALGVGVAGDLVVDVLPEACKDAWDWWSKDRSAEERKADVEAVAQAGEEEVKEGVADILLEVAADKPQDVQEMIFLLLTQVPSMVRKSLRRPSDPVGTTVAPDREPKRAEDLLTFLPPKPPRFKPADHPLPGVDWELVELLGVGGFGEVWKARNPHMPSLPPVALKFCLDSMAGKVLRNEAAVLNRVIREGKHPGIVELLHTYLNAPTPCLEYEFIEGGDLAEVIHARHRSNESPTPEQVARDVLQLAEIVGFAHQLKPPIVHRDLKPANILVKHTSEGGTAFKIADFGIGGVAANQMLRESARGTTQGRFLVSAVRGSFTPLYASPQQMKGDQPDPRDDVHALGVIWYQMLTNSLNNGRPGGDKYKKRLTHLGMKAGMMELMASCFEDEPDDRPVDAAVLAREIRKLLPTLRGGIAGDTKNAGRAAIDDGTKSGTSELVGPDPDASGIIKRRDAMVFNVLLMLASRVKPHPTREEIPFHLKECRAKGATYVLTPRALSAITSGRRKADFPMTPGQSVVAFYGDVDLGNALLAHGLFVSYIRFDTPEGAKLFENHGLYNVNNQPGTPKGFIEVRNLIEASPGTPIDSLNGIIASNGQTNGLVLTVANLPDGAARAQVYYRWEQ